MCHYINCLKRFLVAIEYFHVFGSRILLCNIEIFKYVLLIDTISIN